MTDEQGNENIDVEATSIEEPPQYGVGPFSIREVALAGTWLVAFVVSFFPVIGEIGRGPSVWSNGIDWVLTIGVPTVAVFLIALRRLSPQGIRRVGSLGIDQFASVAFSVSTVLWLTMIWNSFITLAGERFFPGTWVVWVEFFLMLAGVVLTAFAPLIPPFAQDFHGRPEVPAHRNARPVRPVSPRPAPLPRPDAEPVYNDYAAPATPAPAAGTPYADSGAAAPAAAVTDDALPEGTAREAAATPAEPTAETTAFEPTAQTTAFEQPAATTTQHQAFWALVPEERDVVDEIGIPVFRVGPTAWALVIEDRGETFVVRHEDGRIGYLHDVTGVTRG
ncbi:hypothetical protein [Microbacterium cremeum]|uniref:hypothetical protein n=1 Tax=Microbacterium cremeum TaxID=2782169 RepID=UPI001E4B30E0|nr:hypothetical protein [Microbacterium cremeum]